MLYMKLDGAQQNELLAALANMQIFLSETFGSLSAEQATASGPNGTFSPLEQVWHLADLEREGFGLRITRLRTESNPHLPDFDGDRVALERDYLSLSLQEGLNAFAVARAANIRALQSLSAEDWLRSGTQEGVGGLTLCDMPAFMQQHDEAHVAEILAWKKSLARPAGI